MWRIFHNGWFFGMHLIWWLLWIILIVLFFFLLALLRNRSGRQRRESPLETLQRRYAAGELSTQDYEERKARLERDRLAES